MNLGHGAFGRGENEEKRYATKLQPRPIRCHGLLPTPIANIGKLSSSYPAKRILACSMIMEDPITPDT